MLQCDMKAVGHEGDEDVRLNSCVELMENRSEREITLEVFKRLLDLGEADVLLPEYRWIFSAQIRSEEIVAFSPYRLPEFVLPQ